MIIPSRQQIAAAILQRVKRKPIFKPLGQSVLDAIRALPLAELTEARDPDIAAVLDDLEAQGRIVRENGSRGRTTKISAGQTK